MILSGLVNPGFSFANCKDIKINKQLDGVTLWRDINVIANDQMQGRKTGTVGAKLARQYIQNRFKQVGLQTLPQGKEMLLLDSNHFIPIQQALLTQLWVEVLYTVTTQQITTQQWVMRLYTQTPLAQLTLH